MHQILQSKIPLVFVAISFDDKYYNIYNHIQAIAGLRGAKAIRADEDKKVIKKIRPGIFSKIKDADLVVAEISSGSSNVLYEVGWAHAMGKPTMLLAEKTVKIPFDINDSMVVKYDPDMPQSELRKLLDVELNKHIDEALSTINLRQPLVEMLGSIEEISSKNDLFTHLLGWTIDEFSQASRQWISDSIRVNASEAVQKGTRVFQLLKKGGFATYLVPLNSYWKSDDKYSQECRLATKIRRAEINRVFILPSPDSLFSESLRDHIKQDEDAGIRTYIAFADNIPNKDAIQDFGIWDDELLCLIEAGMVGGETQVKGCTFGRDKTSLDKARLWQDTIMSVSQPATKLLNSIDELSDVTKLMIRSADLMRMHSKRYCHGSYLTNQNSSCEWYHSSWQYLRLLGLVSTPDWHSEFYSRALSNAFNSGARDVLISGLADYAILDQVVKAIPPKLLKDIIISVLDICWTPIEICRWYDRWYEEESETHINLRYNQRDAIHTDYNDNTFDLITTDAFLTRFIKEEREKLIKEWYRILKPSGKIITTARLTTHASVNKVTTTEGERDSFVERVKLAIESTKPWLRPLENTISRLAYDYARNITSHPIESAESIKKLFNKFEVNVEIGVTAGEFEGATNYARIIATKGN